MISIARIFGAPDSVPAGNAARSTSSQRLARRERADDVRGHVHDVRVALDRPSARRRAREPTSATRPTSLRPRSISIRCSARSFGSASSSAASRSSSAAVSPRGRVPAIGRTSTRPSAEPDERLGRRAGDARLGELEVEHVRRRVDHAQRAIDVERTRARRRLGEALRQHDLERVAGEDVLLHAIDRGDEVVVRERRRRRVDRCRARRARGGSSSGSGRRGARSVATIASMRAHARS